MLLPLQGEKNTSGIVPQGDALGYVQTMPFQGAIRPPTYSMVIGYIRIINYKI